MSDIDAPMHRRRAFLAAAGSVLTVGIAPTVGAKSESTEPSIEAITRAFHEGTMKDDFDDARQSLEALGLNPTVETARKAPIADSGDGEAVAPRGHYGDPSSSESELVVGVCNAPRSDTVYVTVGMFLDAPTDSWRHATYCPDVIGIGFDSDDWAGVGVPSLETTDRHSVRFRPDTVGTNFLAGAVTLRNHVDRREPGTPPSERFPPTGVTLTGEFGLREDGTPSRFWGTYVHTWAPTPFSGIKNVSAGPGGLDVTVAGLGSTCWSTDTSADPEEYV